MLSENTKPDTNVAIDFVVHKSDGLSMNNLLDQMNTIGPIISAMVYNNDIFLELDGVKIFPKDANAWSDVICPHGFSAGGNGMKCAACRPGTYANDKFACVLCPMGHYQHQEQQSSCLRCPDGKITLGMGSTGVLDCYKNGTSPPDVPAIYRNDTDTEEVPITSQPPYQSPLHPSDIAIIVGVCVVAFIIISAVVACFIRIASKRTVKTTATAPNDYSQPPGAHFNPMYGGYTQETVYQNVPGPTPMQNVQIPRATITAKVEYHDGRPWDEDKFRRGSLPRIQY
ncbi:unnamed protein product [Owenia fusiformis]|uniref:Tyrosine-protein kinase ephrin type A/B receptor-like domain-containing protein n=1 Tax=Owenia fusiformis TaxID=6347 RepID=A0A8S4N882_OWEFU|nr:unnamed protein product [Owenia fusiformis]